MIGVQGLFKNRHGVWHSKTTAAVDGKQYNWTGVGRKKKEPLMHSSLDLCFYIKVVSSQINLSTKG
jgi:hypothetical protein